MIASDVLFRYRLMDHLKPNILYLLNSFLTVSEIVVD